MSWTPDGRSLLAIKRTATRAELWQWPLEGPPRKLDIAADAWLEGATGALDLGFALSRDGTQVAFLSGRNAYEVWALEGLTTPARTARR